MPDTTFYMIKDTVRGFSSITGMEVIDNSIPSTGNEIETVIKVSFQVVIGLATLISIFKDWYTKSKKR